MTNNKTTKAFPEDFYADKLEYFSNKISQGEIEILKKAPPIEVSDWSQKYKLALYSVSAGVFGYFLWRILEILKLIAENTK